MPDCISGKIDSKINCQFLLIHLCFLEYNKFVSEFHKAFDS